MWQNSDTKYMFQIKQTLQRTFILAPQTPVFPVM